RFTITSADSPYSSVEFTASGNYLITEKSYTPYYSPASSLVGSNEHKHGNIFNSKMQASTRDSYDGVIYGKYTINSDGEYVLDGFGTIKVISNGGTAVDLEITTNSGYEIVVGANRDNIMTESDMTNKLCRTWKFSKVHLILWEEGKKVFDKTLSMKEYGEWDELDELPENVIFTKSGTYLVTYSDGDLAVSTWRWENEKKGILRYSGDYDHLYDEYESGTVEVSFDGNQLVIVEEDYDEEYDERYYCEWYLTEA
ncbi:MAG: hypothetical protein K2K45_12400, partial [Muribaculaceae bacterium]|nr:hypothetical protein [Muribaculaceae bacterium]